MEPKKKHKHERGGLAHFGSIVTLAPARAATSHVRRIYRTRYHARYRRAKLVFSFDVFLVGIIVSLLMFLAAVNYSALLKRESGLKVDFIAPKLAAMQPVPVLVTVAAQDGRRHAGVSLRLGTPPWAQVLDVYPKSVNGEIQLGIIEPGKPRTVRAVLYLRAAPGTPVPLGVTLSEYDLLFLNRSFSGMEKRSVESSAVTLNPFINAAMLQTGGVYPVVIENSGSATGSGLGLALTAKDGAEQAHFLSGTDYLDIGNLGPGEKKIILVNLSGVAPGDIKLDFDLSAQANVINRMSAPLAVQAAPALAQVKGTDDDLELEQTARLPVSIVLLSPDAQEAGRLELKPDAPRVKVPKTPLAQALPFIQIEGKIFLGAPLKLQTTDKLGADCSTRYFAASGDQLGVGPLPLRVGEKTTFWIVCTFGSANQSFENLHLSADAADGVSFTGVHTASLSGEFKIENGKLDWISARSSGGEQSGQLVAFEVAYTPNANDIGTTPLLIRVLKLSVRDAVSGKELGDEFNNLKTEFKADDLASGKGTVEE